jgi:hypothetical protein
MALQSAKTSGPSFRRKAVLNVPSRPKLNIADALLN